MPSAAGSSRSGVTSPSRTTHTDDVVAVVSSSRPSSPRKTRARPPRAASTPAMTGAIRGSAQPIAAATGRAGLVSGPRKLKTVGDAHLPPRTAGEAHARVEDRREEEADAGLLHAARDRGGRQVDRDAQLLQDVGGTRRRRRGPAAVLGDGRARRGRDDRRHRGDVDRVRAVAAGADDVDAGQRQIDRRGLGEHLGRQAGDLLGRLPLRPERDGEGRDLHRGGLAGHDLAHRPRRCRPTVRS